MTNINEIISIIVPAYNSENTIETCIKSIINQNFKNFELIIVNDASRDNTEKICQEYALQDSRIKIINHDKNMGVSAARNTGLDVATGDFIGFVDADDHINPDMYEILHNNLIKTNSDISVCEISNSENNLFNSNKIKVFNSKICMKYLFSGKLLSLYTVNKLYKKELFNNLRFPVGKIFEDTILTPQIFHQAKKVVYTPAKLYNYVSNPNSITHNVFGINQQKDIIDSGEFILNFAKRYYPEYIKEAEYRYFWSYIHVFDNIIFSNAYKHNSNYNEMKSKIKHNILKIILNKNFSLKRKISIILGLVSEKIYRKILLCRR
ncbi:MAG: glycosyltransferase [Clostridia bacterium]|nr:glycosyltransferase [Clostridia bacterium]